MDTARPRFSGSTELLADDLEMPAPAATPYCSRTSLFEEHTDAPSPSRVAAHPCFEAITASRGHRNADQEAPSWQVFRPDV